MQYDHHQNTTERALASQVSVVSTIIKQINNNTNIINKNLKDM